MYDKWSKNVAPLLFSFAAIAVALMLTTSIPSLSGGSDKDPDPSRLTYFFDFADGEQGWQAIFADMPVEKDGQLGEEWGVRPLPDEMGPGDAMFVSGENQAGDLCMYLARPIDGLVPGTEYSVLVALNLASKYPEGSVGAGGSPGDSVWLRAGAASVRPHRTVDDEGWYRVAPDMGDMSLEGGHGVPLGTIAKPDDGTDDYVRLFRANHDHELVATADENGRLWVLFGTDSGFEGITSIYYTTVTIFLDPQP
jgi:hypothetical protein